MKQSSSLQPVTLNRVLDATTIEYLQDVVRRVPAADHVYEFARSLVRATRPGEAEAPKWLTDLVQWGAGPRASIYLILAGKARAILHGRMHVSTEDISQVAKPVLRHRITTTFSAEASGISTDKIIERLLNELSGAAQRAA